MPGSCSSASASERTPRASRSAACSVAVRPASPRASSRTVGSRTPLTTTAARVAVGLILGEDAVGAEQPPGLARDVGRHADVVALRERHLLGRDLPLILEAAELEAEQLRLGDFGEHLGEPRLLQLKAADRLAEH